MSDGKVPLGLRIIGTLKLATSFLLAAAAFGIFRMMNQDIGASLEQLVLHMHLTPEKHWINAIIAWASGVEPSHLRAIGTGTVFYAALYAIEGIGLLMGKHWAEYLVVIITGSLLPLEIYEVAIKTSSIRIGVLAINLAIVAYLVRQLKRDRRHHLKSSVVSE